jgi:hypothetical protein
MRRALGLFALIVSVALVVATLARPERPVRGKHAPPLLPRAWLLKIAGRAFIPLISDYYWLQTIQATGKAWTADEYRDVADYAQLVTDLDPDFAYVYQFGGVVVPYNTGREHWVNTAQSSALFEKGIARFPGWVFLRTLLAYNYSVFDHDYTRAARLLEETSKLPGAPEYLPYLATRLYAQAGSFDAAGAFASQLAASSADPETRAAFEHRVLEIRLERILQSVDRAVDAFRTQRGTAPRDIQELVSAGLLAGPPEDPLGGSIYLGADGRAYATSQDHRLEAYDPAKDEQ